EVPDRSNPGSDSCYKILPPAAFVIAMLRAGLPTPNRDSVVLTAHNAPAGCAPFCCEATMVNRLRVAVLFRPIWFPPLLFLVLFLTGTAAAQQARQNNMELTGYDDLQSRSAYQPVIQHQGNRWIAYIGHHAGIQTNPLTRQPEPNGTSIVDVTDPARPRYLAH